MTEQEFQTFLRSIRPADRAAMDAAARRQAELAKPPGSLGALEDVSIRLAGLTGRVKNRTAAACSCSRRITALRPRAFRQRRSRSRSVSLSI